MVEHTAVLERHPQLYFSDGDVVLAAKVSSTTSSESRPTYQLCRVHRPVLRHNSTVFANLFADAAPGELYDDVPLVEMIGDTAEALASLLTFIYNPSDVNVRRWDPDTPIAVSPTVRIANKYLVDALHGYLVRKVKEDWPLTLEDWDRREAEIEAMRHAEYTSGPRPSSSKPLAQAVPEPAAAIRFALEFGCPEILPAAFYQLARTDVGKDWDEPRSYSVSRDTPARWSLLEAPDLLRCLRGAKKISYHTASVMSDDTFTEILGPHSCLPWWENAGFPGDVRDEVDGERRSEDYPCYVLLRSILSRVDREVSPGVRDPLKALKDCKDYENKPQDLPKPPVRSLCVLCDSNLRRWVPKTRQELWQMLPRYFEVPTATST
ncbi:hypothetical protein LXA43DRAFT_930136 [Ganoderma leucocontextum]|nr:hypothetical protein LXA43DRAFT_930136 [Ganoderma leucocontextum]